MNWTLFANLAQQIETPLFASVTNVSDSLIGAVAGPLQVIACIYIAWIGFSILAGMVVEPLRDTWMRLVKVMVVAFFLTSAGYTQYVVNFVLHGIPADIGGAITGSGTFGAASFDAIWNKAFGAGLDVWKNTSSFDVGLQILIGIYWLAAAIACACGFLIYLASTILLGLFVAIGPLVLPMVLFGATRSIFERWIGAMMSMLFLQAFAVIMLAVLLGAENQLLAGIGAVDNAFGQLQQLFAGMLTFIIGAGILVQLPGAATALAGGMHFHAQAIHRATLGRAGAASRAVTVGGAKLIATGAAAGAGAAVRAMHTRTSTPPGPSMSRGDL